MKLSIKNQIDVYCGEIDIDMSKLTTIKSCEDIIHRLSRPSKMPGYSYGLPASSCPTGSKLRHVKGSVCYGCYAADNWEWAKQTGRYSNYAWDVVKNANKKRLAALSDPLWLPAMVCIIRKRKAKYFRWHDTGDLQSLEHLQNIAMVARYTPDTLHWLPTREYRVLEQYRSIEHEPKNLCIRVSAHMIGDIAPTRLGSSSMVYKGKKPDNIKQCRAFTRDNNCGQCRACWNKDIDTIGYKYH